MIIIIVVFFSWVGVVNASVVINEIQLNPTEERFIELYNSGSSSVDLTDWYIQRKTASGSTFGSLVSKTYFDGLNIEASDYLLISRTSLNNPDIIVDNLTLTESNTIQIKNSKQEVVNIFEWDNINEGESIQRISDGNWIIGLPTPGEENKEAIDSSDNNLSSENNVSNTGSSSSSPSSNQLDLVPRKIIAKILPQKLFLQGLLF